MARRTLLALAAVLSLALAGCGNKEEVRKLGETEGVYVDVGGLSYQIQLSRILNPNDVEDRSYLQDLPIGTTPPGRDEAWFAVFMRVNNPSSKESREATDDFRIVDTQDNEFRPLALAPERNPFAYVGGTIEPGAIQPDPNTIQGEGDIQGSLLLFKVKTGALQNRPVEFEIEDPTGQTKPAIVDLDV